ncbi:MAG: hypothetical protein EHM90_05635 [Chloroflexi bacterium]|nr:MAG: hypothetical protein EHM90_05635 [Chloroflexota bacterium]
MPDPGERWRLAAPAKLNLWLRVVGRRPDGFHELESVLVLLQLADIVTVGSDGAELEVVGPHATGVARDHTNLAWRGWTVGMGAPQGDDSGTGVVVDKQIPIAAGLGGGSSDAAAAWRLARRTRDVPDDPPDQVALTSLAAIGADVPFFAAQAAVARVAGIGEVVEPMAEVHPGEEVVLIHAPFGLSTASVFAELRPADWSTIQDEPETGPGRNDLLPAATRLRSEIEDIFRLVAASGGAPHLTGSGPTVFVLTDDPERADGVASRVERAGLVATRTRRRAEPASIEAS